VHNLSAAIETTHQEQSSSLGCSFDNAVFAAALVSADDLLPPEATLFEPLF
jgi:hypothetical protein